MLRRCLLALSLLTGCPSNVEVKPDQPAHVHSYSPDPKNPGTVRCACGAWGMEMDTTPPSSPVVSAPQ